MLLRCFNWERIGWLAALSLGLLCGGGGVAWPVPPPANGTLQDSATQEPAIQAPAIQEPAVSPLEPSGVDPAGARLEPLPAEVSPRELPPVRRAKRPQFGVRNWEGVYFENLFRDGLVGQRPEPGSDPRAVTPGRPAMAEAGAAAATGPEAADGGTWASVIPREALESEVKRLHLQLEQDLTTPIKFKTDYLKVRQSFSLLSLWFAIIFEYDGEVRWKQSAPVAQPACWRAAANARTDGEQAYQYARLRKVELQELIRGGSFGDAEKPIAAVDWTQVVDRVPTMLQLETSFARLKTLTASKSEFESGVEEVAQQAAVISAIGKVLAVEEMEGADDEDYCNLAKEMQGSAATLQEAVKLSDFESASRAVNRVEQSCNKCHEVWR